MNTVSSVINSFSVRNPTLDKISTLYPVCVILRLTLMIFRLPRLRADEFGVIALIPDILVLISQFAWHESDIRIIPVVGQEVYYQFLVSCQLCTEYCPFSTKSYYLTEQTTEQAPYASLLNAHLRIR